MVSGVGCQGTRFEAQGSKCEKFRRYAFSNGNPEPCNPFFLTTEP